MTLHRQGYDKFPEGRNIMLCRMTPADKLRLMRGVPKNAVYIKECIRAFWKMNLRQDLTDTRHMRAESFWHNARFQLNATPRERKSFSTVLDVQIVGDVFDSSTNAPRTAENWEVWIRQLYSEHEEREQLEGEVKATACRLVELTSQMPDSVIQAVQQQAGSKATPKGEAIVALVKPGEQNQEGEVYAMVSACGETRVRLDAYGVPHSTGISNKDCSLVAREVEIWKTKSGGRVRGPCEAIFPKLDGWLLDGRKVKLNSLSVNKMTAALALRKFKPPASEEAWNERRNKTLRWKDGWKITSFYATPRDQVTWLKFQHRTLYTVGHDTTVADNTCRACSEPESQLHLITCGVLYEEYWKRVVELLVATGMEEPDNVTDFLITGQLSDEETAKREYLGVIFIAFRCLYAAIVESRLDSVPLDLEAAYDRMVSMVVSRLKASGEKWLDWVRRGERKRKPHIIPQRHCDKCVMFHEPTGEYELHGAIVNAKCAIDFKKGIGKTRERPARDWHTGPREARTRVCAGATAEAPSVEGTHTKRAQSAEKEEVAPASDEWRDMAGGAITFLQAQARGAHAQCTLAAVRNLRRNPDYSVRRLSERCYGAEYMDDIRSPDWPALILPILREGEVVKRVAAQAVGAEELSDFRAGVVVMEGHVVCFFYDGDGGFRVYDNDSKERQEGRPRLMRADEILDEMSGGTYNTIFGAIQNTSDLSCRLGPAITTLMHTRRQRQH